MIFGIVLAAGWGRRMGSPKALLLLAGETFHSRACRACRDAGLGLIVVVNQAVDRSLGDPGPGERRIVNVDPDQGGGMLGSARLGVSEALRAGAVGAVLLPVDHPLVTGQDVLSVAERIRSGAKIAVATHGGRRGHPIGIDLAVMREILSDPAVATLKDVVRRDRSRVVEVPVSAGSVLGVNTREDLEEASNTAFWVN